MAFEIKGKIFKLVQDTPNTVKLVIGEDDNWLVGAAFDLFWIDDLLTVCKAFRLAYGPEIEARIVEISRKEISRKMKEKK